MEIFVVDGVKTKDVNNNTINGRILIMPFKAVNGKFLTRLEKPENFWNSISNKCMVTFKHKDSYRSVYIRNFRPSMRGRKARILNNIKLLYKIVGKPPE